MCRTVKGSIRDCKAASKVSREEKIQPRNCRFSTIAFENKLIALPGQGRRSRTARGRAARNSLGLAMLAEKAQGSMTGFCRAPGLNDQDITDALTVLPSGLAFLLPIVAMRGKDAAHPYTPILASKSLLNLCGAKNLAGLSRFLSGAEGACRHGSPMLPQISISMRRPSSKRCIFTSAAWSAPSLFSAAAPVPEECRRCLSPQSSMFSTGRRRQLSLRRAPPRQSIWAPHATPTNPSSRPAKGRT